MGICIQKCFALSANSKKAYKLGKLCQVRVIAYYQIVVAY